MASFNYKALNQKGKSIKGTMDGDSARQVRQNLRDQRLTPLSVEPAERKKKDGIQATWFAPTIDIADLSLLTRQLFTLLDAGTALVDALKSIAQDAESKLMKRFVTSLYTKVTEGHSYAQALRTAPFFVTEEYIATIEAGEESGHLDGVLSRLADSIEQQEKIRKKIKSAMIYPVMMVVMAVSIIFFLMAFVVPKVVTVFEHMDQELPPLTQGLLTMSHIVQTQWHVMLLGVFATIVVYKMLMRKDKWRFRRDQLLLSIPALRKFLIYAAASRWARTLSVLHASGVSITDSLNISAEVMTLLPLRYKVDEMGRKVKEGHNLSLAMKEAGFFPPLLLNLVQTGDEKGQIDKMLQKGAEHYEQEVDSAAGTLVSLLEPIMIVVMGGVVLTIVLAIMLPIFEMNKMVS